jgi:hypothetical protein
MTLSQVSTVLKAVSSAPGSSITAVNIGSNGSPRVYNLDSNNHVYELAWFGNNWHFRDLTADSNGKPAAPGSSITVTSVGGNDPRVYYTGNDNHVYELAWFDNNWHFRDVTADSKGKPAAPDSSITTSISGNDPRVYHLSSDNHVYELAWFDNNWHFRDLTVDSI